MWPSRRLSVTAHWEAHPFVDCLLHFHGKYPCLPIDHRVPQLCTHTHTHTHTHGHTHIHTHAHAHADTDTDTDTHTHTGMHAHTRTHTHTRAHTHTHTIIQRWTQNRGWSYMSGSMRGKEGGCVQDLSYRVVPVLPLHLGQIHAAVAGLPPPALLTVAVLHTHFCTHTHRHTHTRKTHRHRHRHNYINQDKDD